MQRGCVSTLAASAKMARDRSAGSRIPENVDGGCKVLEGCAEPATDPATAMQYSNAMTDRARMRPMPPTARTTVQSGKSSHAIDKPDGLRLHWRSGIDLFL